MFENKALVKIKPNLNHRSLKIFTASFDSFGTQSIKFGVEKLRVNKSFSNVNSQIVAGVELKKFRMQSITLDAISFQEIKAKIKNS